MRFSSFLDIFRADNWSNELVNMISEMLDLAHAMFDYSVAVVVNGAPDDDPQGKLYDRDKRINHLERKTRRRVVTRLSVRGSRADIPSALIFMNVVKDAERLGDYVKNVHEIGDMMPDDADLALYHAKLDGALDAIGRMFEDTRHAFAKSDEEAAGRVIKEAKAEGRAYEKLIREITASDMRTADAVCIVLVLRFAKRLVAHMSNIASSIVMPVDMLDFYDEPEGGKPA
jgi:phosphate transport system protein